MADDVTVRVWTRTEVRALRLARRMPLRDFAEHREQEATPRRDEGGFGA